MTPVYAFQKHKSSFIGKFIQNNLVQMDRMLTVLGIDFGKSSHGIINTVKPAFSSHTREAQKMAA